MSSYNMKTSVNNPWTVNSFDGMALNQHNVTASQNQPPITMATGFQMAPSSYSSTNPCPFMSIPFENSFGVVGMGNYCQYGVPNQGNRYFPPVKEIVYLTHCVLYPPNPNATPPTTRERPLGCKTVFVGGLPEKITEEITKEIFERCGTVETVRMSKRNFCHVRFSEEVFVDNALCFSGYRLRIENKDEASFSGRLLVDYAQAREDLYDYESKLQALQHQTENQGPDFTPGTVNSFDGMALNQYNVTVSQNQPPITMAPSSSWSMNSLFGVERMENRYPNSGVPVPAQVNMYFPPIKEIVHLAHCVLYPPNPNVPNPTTRERPLGCKTVFVGGLPEKITEELIKEIFERCGTVETVRMSKKNFCHVRFSEEKFVDNALYFSGYRLRIENKDEASFSGRLHVDYAQARDDQYDYECKQRALQRQARHQAPDYNRSPTPPVVHYTDNEASLICERLKMEESFTSAAGILVTWLEKGEITKKNANSFFSMIQSTHNHVQKLQLDKVKYEEQLNEAKKMLKKQLEYIIRQFTEIEKIYKAAILQKCWDQFTKAQRRNIKMWKRHTEELKNAHLNDRIIEREDEEMDLSENENSEKMTNSDYEHIKKEFEEKLHKTQEENDSLKCQLDAAHNELNVIKETIKKKDCKIVTLQQTSQNTENKLVNCEETIKKKDFEIVNLQQILQNFEKLVNCIQQNEKELKELRSYKHRSFIKFPENDRDNIYENNSHVETSVINSEKEYHLISLIVTFLNAHPFGANIDYICSYLHQVDNTITSRDVENALKKCSKIFREESTGIGASLQKKWYYIGFRS